jgi:ketosteroid isomerase-like protein
MPEVIDRLLAAMNAHDVDAMVDLFSPDYSSEQPVHGGRTFVGSAQVRANWAAMFAGIADFRATLQRSAWDGTTAWVEWTWLGTKGDGAPFEVRGVALFEVRENRITAGTLYVDEVAREPVAIEDAVEGLSGERPDTAR